VDRFPIQLKPSAPLSLFLRVVHTWKATSIVFHRWPVSLVLGVADFTKVGRVVVPSISVDVVDMPDGPTAMNHRKDDAMAHEHFPVNLDFNVPVGLPSARRRPGRHLASV
jgi:hypothetical protein